MPRIDFREYVKSLREEGKNLEEYLSFRPTIFIGIGGFGSDVVRKLKRLFIENWGKEIPTVFQFLGIDTQIRESNDILSDVEYVNIAGGIDVEKVLELDPWKTLKWWKEVSKKYEAGRLSSGANMVRPLGRFGFMAPANFVKVKNAFSTSITNMQVFCKESNLNITGGKAYIISSLAGGTGGGIFVDIAYIVKKILSSNFGADSRVTGILALSEIFEKVVPPVNHPRIYANAYAGMKEVLNFIIGNKKSVKYNDQDFANEEVTRKTIFDVTHIISAVSEKGFRVATDPDILEETIAKEIFLETHTPLKAKFPDGENVDVINKTTEDGRVRAFASFGVASLTYPTEEVMAYCSYRFSIEFIEDLLKLKIENIENEVNKWIDTIQLREKGADQVLINLDRTEQDRPFGVRFDAKSDLLDRDYDRTLISKEAKDYWDRLHKEAEALRYSKEPSKITIRSRGEEFFNLKNKDLTEKVKSLVALGGVTTALEFINKLETIITVNVNDVRGEAEKLRSIQANSINRLNEDLNDINSVALGGFFRRGKKIEETVGAFESDLEEYLKLTTDIYLREEILSLYGKFSNEINQYKSHLGVIQGKLKNVKRQMETDLASIRNRVDTLANVNKRTGGNILSVVDSNMMGNIYAEAIGDKTIHNYDLMLSSINKKIDLWKINEIKEDELIPIFLEEASGFFRGSVDVKTIIEVIEKFYPEEHEKRLMFERVSALAGCLFREDLSRSPGEFEDYVVLGVSPKIKGQSQKYLNFLTGYRSKDLAAIPDDSRIDIFTVRFGHTLDSLINIASYSTRYESELRAFNNNPKINRPIHCYPEAEEWEEIIPSQKEEEALSYFVLGRLLGYSYPSKEAEGNPESPKNKSFIYQRGHNYYLYYEHESEEEEAKLGQGLKEASETFCDNREYIEFMKGKVEAKIREVGNEALKIKIENYLKKIKDEREQATLEERKEFFGKEIKILNQYKEEL